MRYFDPWLLPNAALGIPATPAFLAAQRRFGCWPATVSIGH